MRAHLVQLDIAWENPGANYARVKELVAGSSVNPGDIILLPEMFDTGFSFNLNTTADASGRTADFLRQLAVERRSVVMGGFTVMGSDGKGRNRACIYDGSGGLVCTYDKLHPFNYGREGEFFGRGERVEVVPVAVGEGPSDRIKFCPAICYDLRFPELFRSGLAAGAEVFVVIANWMTARAPHWRALAIARAIENQAIVLAANRCGSDPNVSYPGGSIVIDGQGNVLGEAGTQETVLSVEISPDRLRKWRQDFPAWRDQHPAFWPPKAGF